MRKFVFLLLSAVLAVGFGFVASPVASASHPGTGPVSISHGFKFTPTPGAFTWFGALPNWCTITAVGNDSADRLIATTAGHCVANQNPGDPIYAYENNLPAPLNQPIGTLRSKNTDPNFDYAIIELMPNRVTMHQNGPAGTLVNHVEAPAVGQAVCMVGATSGKHCATVTQVNPNGDVITGVMQGSTGGDSGSPLIVTATNGVVADLRGPVQACPVVCPVTGTLFKNLPRNLAQIPAGQPGSGFVVTVNP